MFRDGHEGDGVWTNDHLLALDRGDLAGWHPEAIGNANYFFLFDVKIIQHVPHRDTRAFDFLFAYRQVGVRGEVAIHKIGPVIRLVCDVKSRK